MRNYYTLNAVEVFITKAYNQMNIISPHDLDIDRISGIWGVNIQYTNTTRAFAQWGASTAVIFLPKHLSKTDQRAAFFHELCHVLRHVGNQRTMTREFRELQEDQAERFLLIASMPFFMICDYLEEPPTVIAEEFQIPIIYVSRRLKQIQEKIIMNSEVIRVHDTSIRKRKWSEETIKVMRQLNHILLNKQHTRYFGA